MIKHENEEVEIKTVEKRLSDLSSQLEEVRFLLYGPSIKEEETNKSLLQLSDRLYELVNQCEEKATLIEKALRLIG